MRINPRPTGAQKGQAIVLIALVMLVMLGMLGLGIDSGRAYIERRTLQNAVDSAALGAGDAQENFSNLTGRSLPQAVLNYANNERLPSTPDNSATTTGTVTSSTGNVFNQTIRVVSWGASSTPGAGSTCSPAQAYNPALNLCIASGGHLLTITATNTQFNGYTFDVVAAHPYTLAFMQVFGLQGSVPIAAEATAIVGNQRQQPALLTLSTAGCGGANTPLQMIGAGKLTVLGDVYSNGCANADAGLFLSGNAYGATGSTIGTGVVNYWCYNSTPGFVPYAPPCNAGDVTGAPTLGVPPLPDPNYQAPTLDSSVQGQIDRGSYQELTPGIWGSAGHITDNLCYFLDPGVYQGDFRNQGGGIMSNELKPPDEPSYVDPTVPLASSAEFWNLKSSTSANCAGAFSLKAVSAGSGVALNPAGSYGVEVTSVRQETSGGPSCTAATPCIRESAPSVCKSVTVTGSQSIEVDLTYNSPGAQSYNVYLDPNGCEAPPNPFTSLAVGTSLTTNTSYSQLSVVALPGAKKAFQRFVLTTGNGQVVTLAQDANAGDTTIYIQPITTSSAYPAGTGLRETVNFDVQAHFGFAANFLAPGAGSPTGYSPAAVLGTISGLAFGAGNIKTAILNNTSYCKAKIANTATVGYCRPPDSERAPFCFANCTAVVSQENAPRRLDPPSGDGGDLANEDSCTPKGSDPNAPCAGSDTTPGAVQFYMAGTACIIQNASSSTYFFSGVQYNWISLYVDRADTSCTMTLNGGTNTAFIGTVYAPGSSVTVAGGDRSPLSGQVIVSNAKVTGTAQAGIDFNPLYAPAPPAARLVF